MKALEIYSHEAETLTLFLNIMSVAHPQWKIALVINTQDNEHGMTIADHDHPLPLILETVQFAVDAKKEGIGETAYIDESGRLQVAQ